MKDLKELQHGRQAWDRCIKLILDSMKTGINYLAKKDSNAYYKKGEKKKGRMSEVVT